MLCFVFLSFCTIIYCTLTGIYGLETDADDLVFEENAVFTINVPLDDDESDEDSDDYVEYTLEKPRLEDGLLKDYEETVVEANLEHNENFDSHSKKKQSDKSKRQIPSHEEYTWRYATPARPEFVYDYEDFKDEYDRQIEEIKKEGSLNETEFISPPKTECAADKFYNKGPFTIWCLVKEYHMDDENLRNNATYQLMQIAQLWAIIFLILVVVGWAHLEDGYEEVKRFLVLNPPGVLVRSIEPKSNADMKTVIKKEKYKPTETEYYLYNNLWQTVYNV